MSPGPWSELELRVFYPRAKQHGQRGDQNISISNSRARISSDSPADPPGDESMT